MKVGLRVDVDTFKGTREGVPRLVNIMGKHNIKATYFFSVGPDNMGRHLWRLLKPKFLIKMLRSNAVGLYGIGIIFQGTFFPGSHIAENNKEAIKNCANAGHDIGIHSWDHHYWQAHGEGMTSKEIEERLDKSMKVLTSIIGKEPTCSAAAGFRCTDEMLIAKEKYGFKYNSDCRGDGIFVPVVNGTNICTPQIPFHIPTYDETIGNDGITDENYNSVLLQQIMKDGDVLTIHAEVEGGKCSKMFDDFLTKAKTRGIEFCPLGELLDNTIKKNEEIPHKSIGRSEIKGREGWVSVVL